MTKLISLEEYHRFKSYHPRRTTREQLNQVPHVCKSKEWRTSPHCGKQCWNCVEVTKIIEFENIMEDKYQNRQHTLHPCYCHWCKNRLQKSHETCITCNPEKEFIIELTDSDEEEVNNLKEHNKNKSNSITNIPWSLPSNKYTVIPKRNFTRQQQEINNICEQNNERNTYNNTWSANNSETNSITSIPWSQPESDNNNQQQKE